MDRAASCQMLIISNFPSWEVFIGNMLSREGHPDDEVCFASSGHEGLLVARQAPLDIIIYYLWTLDLNGYEFCQQIKTVPALQNMPVLLQGALSPTLVYPEAQRVGAAGYLRQPVEAKDLVAARDAVLRGDTYYPPGPYGPMAWETPTDEKGRRVLVIDDKPGIGDLIQTILGRGRNDEVRYANGGRRGLTAAKQDPPDLIILNTTLPDSSGLRVYRQLRAMPILEQTPVLFQTAWDPARSHPEAQRLGAAGCLTLPIGPHELLAARDAALEGETYYP
jgi:DNA-binding response OmpR family regulator